MLSTNGLFEGLKRRKSVTYIRIKIKAVTLDVSSGAVALQYHAEHVCKNQKYNGVTNHLRFENYLPLRS